MIPNISALKILSCIGEINDNFIEEAATADIASLFSSRKRIAKIGAVAAVASVGFVVALSLIRSRRNKLAA